MTGATFPFIYNKQVGRSFDERYNLELIYWLHIFSYSFLVTQQKWIYKTESGLHLNSLVESNIVCIGNHTVLSSIWN